MELSTTMRTDETNSSNKKSNKKSLTNSRISKMPIFLREMLAEMVGTFLLILFGQGSIATYLLNRNSKIGIDLFSIAFTFGIGALAGISASMSISGGHLNPAVTLAFAISGRFPLSKVPHYFFGQYFGALLSSMVIFVTYYQSIKTYDNNQRIAYAGDWFGNNQTRMAEIATGGIFATFPAPWNTVVSSLVDQIVATFLLVFSVLAVTNKRAKLPDYLYPFILGLVICGVVVAFGLQCGAALNPARDLAPRLFLLISGYGFDSFRPVDSLYWLVAGIIGPHIGGILAAWLFDFLLWDNP